MPDFLHAAIDRLVEGTLPVSASDVEAVTDYLTDLVRITAARQRPRSRDLLGSAPPARLVPRQSEFPSFSVAWIAESYVESFYPEKFDAIQEQLRTIGPGEARWKSLRWHFIEWLHETWKKEECDRPLRDQMPEDRPEQETDQQLTSFSVSDPDPVEAYENLRERCLQLQDPMEAWVERNRGVRQWQPFIELLYDTKGELRLALTTHARTIKAPSQYDVDDCWFRALWAKATDGGRTVNIRELAKVCGIPVKKVDYLIKLEKGFHPTS